MLSTVAVLAAKDGGSALSLLFLPLMFVGAYFLLIRPQRRRMRDQASLQSTLAEGDEVITTSGMYGFITGFEGDIVWLEIDDNIQIRVARQAVQRKVDTSAGTTAETEKDSDANLDVADESSEN
ncbi:MAG: preprotein translocase subunit YajC [Ilumatobacteraceae bacterium]